MQDLINTEAETTIELAKFVGIYMGKNDFAHTCCPIDVDREIIDAAKEFEDSYEKEFGDYYDAIDTMGLLVVNRLKENGLIAKREAML